MTGMRKHETEFGLFSSSPLMTIRVSRDSGKTWGAERALFATDDLPPLTTTEWPPCLCRHCGGRGKGSGF